MSLHDRYDHSTSLSKGLHNHQDQHAAAQHCWWSQQVSCYKCSHNMYDDHQAHAVMSNALVSNMEITFLMYPIHGD